MLKTNLTPEIPQTQIEAIRPVLEPLLARLRAQVEKLPPQAASALVFDITPNAPEGVR
jgi:hypothetical protein